MDAVREAFITTRKQHFFLKKVKILASLYREIKINDMLKTQRSELHIHIDQMLLLAQPLFTLMEHRCCCLSLTAAVQLNRLLVM